MESEPIKIITEPKLYLVGRQAADWQELARFLDDEGSPEWSSDAPSVAEGLVETAGRLCYMSFKKPRPGGNRAYIEHILETGHGSVLEHAVWTILVTGISRSLTHELVRHRVGISPSQLSQRFVDESEAAFVVPPALIAEVREARHFMGKYGHRDAGNALSDVMANFPEWIDAEPQAPGYVGLNWLCAMERSVEVYAHMAGFIADRDARAEIKGIDPATHPASFATVLPAIKTRQRKRAREAARSVLPGATETKIALTGNARAWRHLCEMRGAIAADLEFRRLACALARLFKAESPHLFADCEVVTAEDGREAVTVVHRKV